ncbi:MAG: hypothetical protein IJN90_04965 [Bacilli bacterium]|nr:hypothetical protein [Bacilli bacterium]
MENVILEKKEVLDYVETSIADVISTPIEVIDDKFHHNTRYEDTISIVENGILSGKEQNKIGLISDETLELFDDTESHANGSESISLAVVGMTDLNPDEFEYNPFCEKNVDILITSDISARRVSTNYGNEYLSDESIMNDKFRAIDTRLLAYIAAIRMSTVKEPVDVSITQVLKNYNNLKELANVLKVKSLDIPLREMSTNQGTSIDIDKLSSMPKVKMKRM